MLLISVNLQNFELTATIYNYFLFRRVVPEIDRSATQGLKQFVSRALGFVPGPIIFGAIIDGYCSVWRGEGADSGSCWVYDIPG